MWREGECLKPQLFPPWKEDTLERAQPSGESHFICVKLEVKQDISAEMLQNTVLQFAVHGKWYLWFCSLQGHIFSYSYYFGVINQSKQMLTTCICGGGVMTSEK